MTGADDRPEEFRPPTALESAVRAVGADTIRYRVDYIMLPMRDGIRLATVVFRPRAEGRYPTLLVRSPYAAGSGSAASPLRTTSRLATGSALRSQAPTSRSPTATGMPATATTWPPMAQSPISPCTTDKVTSRRCTSAPTPVRSRSTRRCPTPGPAAGRATAPSHTHAAEQAALEQVLLTAAPAVRT